MTTTDRDEVFITEPVQVEIITAYIEWRKDASIDRFFLQVNADGTAKNQPIGKNSLSKFGSEMATLLGLEDPELYTSHCWRRTALTVMSNQGKIIPLTIFFKYN